MGKRRGNGEGSIYQRGDGRWCGQVTTGRDPVSGRLKRETVYGKTRKEVVDKLDELRAKVANGSPTGSMTFRGAVEMWKAEAQLRVDPFLFMWGVGELLSEGDVWLLCWRPQKRGVASTSRM